MWSSKLPNMQNSMNEFKYSDQSHFEAEFQLRNFHRSTCGCLEFVLTQGHPIEKIPRFAPKHPIF